MAEGLFDAYQKLSGANAHLTDLQALLAREQTRRDSHGVVVDYDTQDRCHYVSFQTDPDRNLPSLFGLILGDIVNNARGALDIVAWQLATQHLKREPLEEEAKSIQFPITRGTAHFASSGVLKYVSEGAGEEMKRHQPPPGSASHPLALLNWISKRDKHRLVVGGVTSHSMNVRNIVVAPPHRITHQEDLTFEARYALIQRWGFTGNRIRLPTTRLVVEPAITARNAQIHADAEFPFDVTFPGPVGDFRIPEIEAVYERVQYIVRCFDRFFGPPVLDF